MRDPVERKTPSPEGGGGQAAVPSPRAERPGSTGTMSIGEVLAVLKPEFADITVSKIRFLEGAGLVQPDRSASGYRKFSDDDVARLRFVLRAQRDQYLPLRVIRQRLADLEQVGGLHAKGGPAAGEASGAAPAQAAPGRATVPGAAVQPGAQQDQAPGAGQSLGAAPAFGLVSARGSGERGAWYGGDDLVLLRLARELADYGLEARHLRMYKLFAEREAALFEQVVAPLVRQRNPEARTRARQTIEALAQLGSRMRELALRTAVRGLAEARESHR